MAKKILYLDCEWFINQNMYLVGYAYNLRDKGQLWGRQLTRRRIEELFNGVDYVVFWGPDIGMLEKCFEMELKGRYKCINFLTVVRYLHPRAKSFKLAHWERLAGIQRETMEYKTDIWKLSEDWTKNRARCLQYNMEDVINMVYVQRYVFKRFEISWRHVEPFMLVP